MVYYRKKKKKNCVRLNFNFELHTSSFRPENSIMEMFRGLGLLNKTESVGNAAQ